MVERRADGTGAALSPGRLSPNNRRQLDGVMNRCSTAHGGQVNNDGCLLSGLPQTETENLSVGLWLVFCTPFAAEPGVLRFEKSKNGGLFYVKERQAVHHLHPLHEREHPRLQGRIRCLLPRHAAYVLELLAEAKKVTTDPIVLIEQRLDYSKYVESGFGTGDCVLIADGTLNIVDYKHGKGVEVSAEHNPQMMLYALGALEIFDALYDIDTVTMTIYQPRRSSVSTYTVSTAELLEWAETVLKPTDELAFKGEGEFHCGEWRQFCKAKADCRERARANLALAAYDFAEPPLLTDEEVEEVLSKVDDLVSWANDIKEYALQAAISGKAWNGWKVVEGRSNRKYTDERLVAAAIIAAGHDPYEQKLLGITEMQKTLGKGQSYQESPRCE